MTDILWFWLSAWVVGALIIFISIPFAMLIGKFWCWLEKKYD